jgi:hypothetical protein
MVSVDSVDVQLSKNHSPPSMSKAVDNKNDIRSGTRYKVEVCGARTYGYAA